MHFVKNYRDWRLLERELKDMYLKNVDEVAKKAKKLKSKKQAVKAVTIANKKRPIQEEKKKTNEFFRAELIKCKPERFSKSFGS